MTDSTAKPLSLPTSRARITRLACVSIVMQTGLTCLYFFSAENSIDINGIQLGFDFVVFHEASHLAWTGDLVAAFEQEILVASLEERIGHLTEGHYWLYPPTFALMILPLAIFPFSYSFWLWTALGLSVYGAGAWLLSRDRIAVLACFGYSAVWVAAYHGQNSFFTAALFMVAMSALLRNKDRQAGIAIGLLAIKPHLAILFPIVLILCGRWRAFFYAGVTATLFVILSTLVLGTEYLSAFFAHSHNMAALIERPVHWMTTATIFMMLKLFGLSTQMAFIGHFMTAIAVTGLLAMRVRQFGISPNTLAMFIAASLMVSPYIADYDLTILASAGLLLFTPHINKFVGRYDFWVAIGLALIPIMIVAIGRLGLQIGWLAPVGVFILADIRLRKEARLQKGISSTSSSLNIGVPTFQYNKYGA